MKESSNIIENIRFCMTLMFWGILSLVLGGVGTTKELQNKIQLGCGGVWLGGGMRSLRPFRGLSVASNLVGTLAELCDLQKKHNLPMPVNWGLRVH